MKRPPEIDGFELQDLIGRGGFSSVYRAFQPRLNRQVAVKVIDADLHTDEDARRRFERECQTLGSLTGHHAVVMVHEVGDTPDGRPFIAMELLEGGSLQDRLRDAGPLPWPEVAAVGVQVAEALAAAHELGILHRDVKPANVMRDRFGRHKLGDFGIAGLASSAQTTAGAAAATVAYAAPEVLLGKRATAASDLYGLGATLYALLSGAPAFASETDESIVPMVMRVTSDPPPELPVAIAPDAFRSLLASLMVKDPAGRPADAVQVGSMLKAIEASHLLETTQTHSPPVEEAETVSLATSRLADPEVPAVERADPVAPPLGGEQTVVHERPDPGAAPNAPTVLPRPDRAGPSSWDPQPEAPSGGSGGASSGRGGEGAPPLPVGGPPPATPGRAPSIGARALASILDWAVLAALMGVAFALIAPFGYPTHDVIMTFEPGGSSTRVDLGLSGVTMTADDYGTTVTVRNETDDVLRVALAPHGAGESDRYPTNGATVDPRSERTFGLGKLPAGSYDVVLVGADRSDTAVFDGSSGVGAIRLEAAPGFGVAEVIAIGALAAAVLAVGWPVAAILALTSLLTVLSDPWDHVSGARAVFGAVVLLVALVYEVVVRWRREASIGESVAHIAVGSASGGRASFGALLVRWLAKPISSIPVLAGYWWPRTQGGGPAWHDRVANVAFREDRPTEG